MKMTVEISDGLLREAREIAARENIPLRASVERGLRRVIVEANKGATFKLRRAGFRGEGLQAEFRDA